MDISIVNDYFVPAVVVMCLCIGYIMRNWMPRTVRLLLLLSAVRRSPETILLSTLQSSKRTNVLA